MGKCKTKSHSGIIRHVQAYSEASVTLEFLEPQYIENLTYSELKAYPEPWHIQNPGIFRTSLYSERWDIRILRYIQKPVKHL